MRSKEEAEDFVSYKMLEQNGEITLEELLEFIYEDDESVFGILGK